MTKAIIHIGQHKTGSSSIQYNIGSIDRNSEGTNFRYLNGRFRNHSFITSSAFGNLKNAKYYKKLKFGNRIPMAQFSRSEARDKIEKEVKKAKSQERALVISAEDFCCLHHDEVVDAKEFLTKCGVTSFQIIGYIRNIQSWTNSFSQQMIKQGNVTIEDVLKNVPYPMYRELFEKFFNVFGAENVLLRTLDRKLLTEGCVVQDFLHMAGLTVPKEELSIRQMNVSLNADQTHLASFVTKSYREKKRKDRKTVSSLFQKVGTDRKSKKFCLPDNTIKASIVKATADLDWLATVTDLDYELISRHDLSGPSYDFDQGVSTLDLAELVMLISEKVNDTQARRAS